MIYRIGAEALTFLVVSITPHDLSEAVMKEFRPAKKRAEVSVGELVRILRDLQGFSQNQLAELSGIPQATQSGVGRAKVLARALRCRLAVLFSLVGKCLLKTRPARGVRMDADRRFF